MSKKHGKSLARYVIIPAIIIVCGLSVLLYYIWRLELNIYKGIFDGQTRDTVTSIEQKLRIALSEIESVRAYFLGSEKVESEEFSGFAKILIESASKDGLNITLEWIDENNNIRYVYPINEFNAKVINTDLNKFPNRLIPIEKAKLTKSPISTDPIFLGQGYPGIVIYSPIYNKQNIYLGSAVGVVRISEIFNSLTNLDQVTKPYIEVGNYVLPLDKEFIYTRFGERIINPQGDTEKDPQADIYKEDDINEMGQDISFTDKTWRFEYIPNYLSSVRQRVLTYLVASLIFAISLIYLLYIIHKREDLIEEEKAKTESFLLSIGDGLIACDKKGIVIYANETAAKISQTSISELIGNQLYDVWPAVDDKGNVIRLDKRPYHEALSTGKITTSSMFSRYYLLRKDGSKLAITSTASPILVDGNVTGAIVSFRDVSKESEIDRMKTEFLSLASHQLLTPIAAARWISELLLDEDVGKLNDKQRAYITDIHDTNLRMSDLVKSLLNISRIESGRLVVEPEPLNLRVLLDQIIKEVTIKISDKKQILDVNSDPNLPMINVDPKLIREVYKNFLTNAIKYTPENGKISVEIKVVDQDVVSKITDTGYGIPEKEQEKVFGKFYRGGNIINKEKDGNGLGLYLIKEIIDVSGGKVWFESKINQGTTFWFSIPLSGSKAKAGEVSIS